MTTLHYVEPLEQPQWATKISGSNIVFDFEYDEGRERLLSLYEKGKNLQWNAQDRIDWSHELNPDNPTGAMDNALNIYGSDQWERLDEKGRGELRRHNASWTLSQFLHGEQGALICASRIVESVPNIDAKFYAATQVIDEARHVEIFSRIVNEKIGLVYPMNPHLKALLDQVISDSRWDMIYLGMQVLIEGLALAAFGLLRDLATDPLIRAANAYIMQDEARHVAFGRIALREFYPQITEAERSEREEFVVEACYLMRDRLIDDQIWTHLGLDYKKCLEYAQSSPTMRQYRSLLFTRIVPTIKDIGLWGPKVQAAYADMGVLDFAAMSPDELSANDEQVAKEMDALQKRQ